MYNIKMPTRSFPVKSRQDKQEKSLTFKEKITQSHSFSYVSVDAEVGGYQSIARRSIYLENTRIKDVLMDIATQTDETNLTTFVWTIFDLLYLFTSASP